MKLYLLFDTRFCGASFGYPELINVFHNKEISDHVVNELNKDFKDTQYSIEEIGSIEDPTNLEIEKLIANIKIRFT